MRQKVNLFKNTEISVWNTIYYTSGMSPPSKITTFWLTFGTFFATFSRVPKKLLKKHLRETCFKKSYHFRPTLGSQGGGSRSPFSHLFHSFGALWANVVPRRLRDPPEPPFFKIFGAKISMFHDFGSENRRNVGRVWRLVFTPQT